MARAGAEIERCSEAICKFQVRDPRRAAACSHGASRCVWGRGSSSVTPQALRSVWASQGRACASNWGWGGHRQVAARGGISSLHDQITPTPDLQNPRPHPHLDQPCLSRPPLHRPPARIPHIPRLPPLPGEVHRLHAQPSAVSPRARCGVASSSRPAPPVGEGEEGGGVLVAGEETRGDGEGGEGRRGWGDRVRLDHRHLQRLPSKV